MKIFKGQLPFLFINIYLICTCSDYWQAFTDTGKVKNVVVAIKKLGNGSVNISDLSVLLELKTMKHIKHENVNQFVGVCFEQPNACVLMTYAPRGSLCGLCDILQDEALKLNWDFKLSLITDIVQGMKYLHSTPIGRCFVTNRKPIGMRFVNNLL